ncbi:DeoR/GlpR family DNA-binding transcription regulator [Parasphaerochaeta coccoides]|uniref:Transcriptional regulator, DeoR family n=1 Tax=Parasphaerochaeta coccoides (strain ATCC BAA-1237 / DSM 17374 / SPN1) TaxID=760011 RepID=F4GJ43_PARC1|nr:DeoR/GlpR family DNA-binding transcription regulator [Parasphaerochaeta coccoides]AEC01338.1 transcriptional regulator, DeoR family [Parasphaerochaeta coccoides DSM 17374]
MTERKLMIIKLISERGAIEVTELARELGMSAVTIRKDLDQLEQEGLLVRHHGYAVPVSSDDIRYRMTFNYEVKQKIAKMAAGLVKNGESVMIESGSTCAMLAYELAKSRKDVMIITNSAFIADFIRRCAAVRITLLGGYYDHDAQVMSGPLTRLCAQQFSVDKFFMGTDGYEVGQGFSNVDLQRAETVRAMAGSAKHNIIVADSSKFNKRGVVSLMRADEVSYVVTDFVPENCHSDLERNGVKILLT